MKFFVRSLFIALITLILISATYFASYACTKSNNTNILNIFVWGDFFPEETLQAFEKETGIKLNVNFYTSNEDLILKLESSKGKGYDLVFPSDYAVTKLRQKGLLKPLDHSRFDFMERIEPFLLDRPFDPKNAYSVPYFWEVYGITQEKSKVPPSFKPSLGLLFDGSSKVVMTDDPVEALDFASHYLYGYKKSLTPKEEHEVIQLLKKQKKWVEAYTDDRVQYMISSKDCPTALLRVSFFWKHYEELSHLQLYLPKEGVFTTIETIALSAASEHVDAAYQFINYIYQPKLIAAQLGVSPLFPACKDALPYTPFAKIPRYHEVLDEIQGRDDFFFTHYIIPQARIRPAWVEIKS